MTDTPHPIPRIALITGATSGIGRVTAIELARQGWQVFLACRDGAGTQAVIDEIRALPGAAPAEWLPLELGDFASVRACAARFLARGLPLQLLINNAGVAGRRGLTASGFELTFGTNHLGHFLLTQLLLERLKQSAPARIVTVTSMMHKQAPGIAWDAQRRPARSLGGLTEYRVSKLANALFSAELGRRLAGSGVTTYAVHPGVVATGIWRALPGWLQPLLRKAMRMVTPEEGARTTLHCATAPELAGESGLYYERSRAVPASALARDEALARELWTRSEAWVAPR